MAGASSLITSFYQYLNIDDSPQFVDPLSGKYLCVYCHNGLRIPVQQTTCGHRLCHQCVEVLLSDGEPQQCPQGEEDCEIVTLHTVYPDRATDREILRMKVYCKHYTNCTKIIQYRNLETHLLTNCEFHLLPCPNAEQGCRATYRRSDECHHIEQECKYAFLSCKYCTEQLARMDMKEHEERCMEEETSCSYAAEGCDFVSKRKSIKEHFENPETQGHHLYLCTVVLRRLKSDKTSLISEMDSVQMKINMLESNTATVIQDVAELKTGTNETQSNMQKTISKYIGKVDELKKDTKSVAETTSVIQTLAHRIDILEDRQHFVKDSSNASNNNQATAQNSTSRTIAAHDVALAEYEIRFRCLETANYDGLLMWKISNYRQRKQMAVEGRTNSLYSQPFYTHRYGYKMCGRLYLAGDGIGNGTHASLYFVLMKGDYDSLLPWPFRQRVTLTLVDQDSHRNHITDSFRPDPTSSSFQQPVRDINIASGSPKFVQQSVIDNSPFLKDDTVFITIKVDTTDLNPLP